jgi:hypothetical protein
LSGDFSDFWEYTTSAFINNSVSSSAYCAGTNVTVSFTSADIIFNSGNIFTAQLSNASGSFASPVNIGTLTSTSTSGNISATIPSNTAYGTGYRIRVVSSNPSFTGSNNGSNIQIDTGPPSITSTGYIMIYTQPGDENEVCKEAENTFDISVTAGSITTWTLQSAQPGGLSWTQINDEDLYLYMWKSNQLATFSLEVANSCSTLSHTIKFKTIDCEGLSIFPNPTSSTMQLKLTENDFQKKEYRGLIQRIKIIDKTGNIQKMITGNQLTSMTINISDLQNDYYTIMVFDGVKWFASHFLKR